MRLSASGLATLTVAALALAGCAQDGAKDPGAAGAGAGEVGTIAAQLTLPDDSEITTISFTITGPGGYSRTGNVPVGNSTIVRFRVGGIPQSTMPYTIVLNGMTSFDELCTGTNMFTIPPDTQVVSIVVPILCGATDPEGDLIVDGDITSCPLVQSVSATPGEVTLGNSLLLEAALTHGSSPVVWAGPGGTFSMQSADSYDITYTCATAGDHNLTVTVANPAVPECNDSVIVPITCTLGAGCGNGQMDPGEQCDDDNDVNDDGCTNGCRLPDCGDGIVQMGSGETCDDMNDATEECAYGLMSCMVCGSSCTQVAGETDFCGDMTIDMPQEDCDGGAMCNPDCTLIGPECGNGIPEAGEECDDGDDIDTNACANDCTLNNPCDTCRVEQCDDYQSVNWVLGCFDAGPDGNAARAVAEVTLTPAQVQTCVNAMACADADPQNCLYDPIAPVTACYCGTGNDTNYCNNAANPISGDCQMQWEAMAGSTTRGDVMLSISDISLPSGWAYFLAECSRLRCNAQCN